MCTGNDLKAEGMVALAPALERLTQMRHLNLGSEYGGWICIYSPDTMYIWTIDMNIYAHIDTEYVYTYSAPYMYRYEHMHLAVIAQCVQHIGELLAIG